MANGFNKEAMLSTSNIEIVNDGTGMLDNTLFERTLDDVQTKPTKIKENIESVGAGTEISQSSIVADIDTRKTNDIIVRTKPNTDKLFSVTEEQLKHNSLCNLICPVSDYVFWLESL